MLTFALSPFLLIHRYLSALIALPTSSLAFYRAILHVPSRNSPVTGTVISPQRPRDIQASSSVSTSSAIRSERFAETNGVQESRGATGGEYEIALQPKKGESKEETEEGSQSVVR
jgi:hypothetical protein